MTRKRKPPPPYDPATAIACPACGHKAESDNYDCGGAAPACLWCNSCGAHFHAVTLKLVAIAGTDGRLF